MRTHIFIILITALFLSGCLIQTENEVWSGVILDDQDLPVADAHVTIGPWSTTTDNEGNYQIFNLEPGVAEITISAPGHQGIRETITLSRGQMLPQFRLQRLVSEVQPEPDPTPGPSPDPTPEPPPQAKPVAPKNQVNKIRVEQGSKGPVIVIEGTLPSPKVQTLTNPDRIVIDLPDTQLNVGTGGSSTIRPLTAWRSSPQQGYARIVLDLERAARYHWEIIDGGILISIERPLLPQRTIVIDPGHGGGNPGTVGYTFGQLKESEVVLDVSLKLAKILEQNGYRPILTRTTEASNPGLQTRLAMAHNNRAAAFVSVHVNWNQNSSIKGSAIYLHNDASSASWALARSLRDGMVKATGRPTRGIFTGNFGVLRGAQVPAALVEIAFMSNREDESLLWTQKFRTQAAEGIFLGLKNYFGD